MLQSPETNKTRSLKTVMAAALLLAGCSSHAPEVHAAAPTPRSAISSSAAAHTAILFASNRDRGAGSDAHSQANNYNIYREDFPNDNDKGVVTDLTNDSSNDMNPELSPDGKRVVFYSDRSGTNQIYQFALSDPSNVTRLTNDGANDYDPVFMPSGEQIVYKSNKADGYGDIWEMRADGSDAHNLTPTFGSTEEWKPEPINATEIVFTSRRRANDPTSDALFGLDLTTGTAQPLPFDSDPTMSSWYPAYSPAAGKLAFVSKDAAGQPDTLYMAASDSSVRTAITDPQTLPGDSDDPSWSPDGQRVVFVNSGASDSYAVYELDVQSGRVWLTDTSPDGQDLSPSFISVAG